MQAVAGWLADRPLNFVYSSPLRRAAEPAAELAAKRLIPHSEVMDLCEVDFGDWEGRSYEAIAAQQPELYAKMQAAQPFFTFPNGETIDFFRRRVQTAFAQVVRITTGPAAIYAHGGSIRMILAGVKGITPADAQKLTLSPGGITVLQPKGSGYDVPVLNAVEHLPAEV